MSNTSWPSAARALATSSNARAHAGDGSDDLICAHHTYTQLLLLFVLFFDLFAPRERMTCVVVLPGLPLYKAACEVRQVLECARHWAENTRYALLA
jgi:hypothetical protein